MPDVFAIPIPIVSAGGVIELPVEYLKGLRRELEKCGGAADLR